MLKYAWNVGRDHISLSWSKQSNVLWDRNLIFYVRCIRRSEKSTGSRKLLLRNSKGSGNKHGVDRKIG